MRNRKGQSTIELTFVIVVVVAAIIGMSIFMKRSVMGKYKESGDQVGSQFTPENSTSQFNRTFAGSRNDTVSFDGQASSTIIAPEVQNRTGNEGVQQDLAGETLF